jgi:hypothetical protein
LALHLVAKNRKLVAMILFLCKELGVIDPEMLAARRIVEVAAAPAI